jgi:hypothetical protein
MKILSVSDAQRNSWDTALLTGRENSEYAQAVIIGCGHTSSSWVTKSRIRELSEEDQARLRKFYATSINAFLEEAKSCAPNPS